MECYDYPSIAHGNNTPIVENMTFNLETPYYELGWGGMMIEDTFVMTANGLGSQRSRQDSSMHPLPHLQEQIRDACGNRG